MNAPLLQVADLTTHLGDGDPVRAVDGIGFDIRPGETFALLGESGCGKSMTALSIMRLLPPSGRIVKGSVLFHDRDVLKVTEVEMRTIRGGGMAMIFQEPMTSLNPVLTVGHQIGEALRIRRGLSGKRALEETVQLLHAVGIPDPEQRTRDFPHQLSGGMKQRVMIAIALAGEPQLLIADEPTTALDVTIQAQVLALIRRLQAERGMAILLITHDLGVVAEMADRVAVMYAGEIVELAERKDFFEHPRHPYSQRLFQSLPGLDKRHRTLDVITGFVPSLRTEFRGCRFAVRCNRVMPVCHEQVPPWGKMANGQRVMCHLYTDGDPAAVPPSPAGAVATAAQTPRSSVDEPLLQVTGLKVHFPIHAGVFRRTVGHVRAVDGVDLQIARGQTLALVGESGCGKTTVGKSILQLIRPTAGFVLFAGTDLTRLGQSELRGRRASFQIVFQDPYSSMNPRMMVGDLIAEGMKAQKLGSLADRSARVRKLLDQVGLPANSVDRYPHEFSGGQRQRISIARALAVDPRLIVCDEPTSALDVSVQAQILNLLKQLQQDLGLSYLFITHNISVVAYLAHEVSVMYLGRIVEHGTVEEILTRPRHPYTRALLSAVPTVDVDTRREVIRLSGDMPSPSQPPAGCHFHPRCRDAMTVCRHEYPPRHDDGPTHQVHCHLYSS